ncbi:MAG: isoaspartyl peptidase/L-asparaginase [Candidatus Eremiobacteraeota bacterium]|nr:isoaspartyl peptidase/L-asparaginase [Candidatus Eremiobacteraeota bacterium]
MKKWVVWVISLLAFWVCQQRAGAQQPYALVVHGGAGADPAQMEAEEIEGVKARITEVLSRGLEQLKGGHSALRVVEEAVRALEDDPWFNAGRGAALNSDGEAELDAAIMDGSNLRCGSVADVRRVKNPITLARWVVEKTPHVLLVGPGADRFGQESGLEIVDPEYFITARARRALRKKQGTVGCVALDRQGHLAAATSTGGLTNKRPGRVGDSPVIGAGTFADDRSCAVSCTGVGEEFIRHQVAGQISQRIRLTGVSLPESVRQTFADGLPDDVGGVIALNRKGEWVMHFNTPGMSRGVADSKGLFKVAIGKEPS